MCAVRGLWRCTTGARMPWNSVRLLEEVGKMKLWKAAASSFGVLALAAALVVPASAADESKMTYGFFMNPTEVPGGKTIPAGLYGFKIVSETPTSTVVQIVESVPSGKLPPTSPANKDAFTPPADMPVVATIVAVPDFKNRPGN